MTEDDTTTDEDDEPKRTLIESDYGDFDTQDAIRAAELFDSEIVLDEQQRAVVNQAILGDNIFLTAAAGCGKTATLKELTKKFDNLGFAYASIAPTGMSAYSIGGRTIHSFAGWSLETFKKPMKEIIDSTSSYCRNQIQRINALIIDEISMLDRLMFERLHRLMCAIRGLDKAFGGVQVIVLGDFHQLQPVDNSYTCIQCGKPMMKSRKEYTCPGHCCYPVKESWAFNAECWELCRFKNIILTKNYRQHDPVFLRILQKMRTMSSLTATEIATLQATRLPSHVVATKLRATNDKVNKENALELAKLSTPPFTFNNSIGSITLKVGAKVVLLRNLDVPRGLVNGAQGVITSLDKHGATVRFTTEERITPENDVLPLSLAWSMTIHKSQSLTIPYVDADLSNCRPGMGYVALSRVKSGDRVQVTGLVPSRLRPTLEVVRFYESLR